MQSNWEIQKAKSKYHFNNDIIENTVEKLGCFSGDWSAELREVISSARPATWRDRSKYKTPGPLIDAEEYDLSRIGADTDMVFSHLEYNLAPAFKKMVDFFGLINEESRVHVQCPGQVFIKHIDKLEKFYPEDPARVTRIMVMLTDWDQGHFNQYGNYVYQQWKAGDIHTFDWMNVPHSSANAGLTNRVSLLITGVKTDRTYSAFKELAANIVKI